MSSEGWHALRSVLTCCELEAQLQVEIRNLPCAEAGPQRSVALWLRITYYYYYYYDYDYDDDYYYY